MPNNAEVISSTTVLSTLRKVHMAIQSDCKTLEDAEKMVYDLIKAYEAKYEITPPKQ